MIIDHTKIAGQKYRTDQGDEVALNRSEKGMKQVKSNYRSGQHLDRQQYNS